VRTLPQRIAIATAWGRPSRRKTPVLLGEVRVPAHEPEAVDLDPGVLARRFFG